MSISSGGRKTPGVKYTQNALDNWKEEFPWIARHPNYEDLVICRTCRQAITPKRDKLLRHSQSKSHTHLYLFQEVRTYAGSQSATFQPVNTSKQDVSQDVDPPDLTGTQIQTLSGDIKDGAYFVDVNDMPIKIIGIQGEEINLEMLNMEGEHIDIPYTRIQANTTFPDNIKNEIYLAFFSAQGWDATWKCEDSLFKVHKFVLALFSPYLGRLMDEDETETCIYTPELTCSHIRSILCLFYTGCVVLSDEEQAIEIENTLKLLECVGSINIEKYTPPKNDEDAFIEPIKKEISSRPIVAKKKKAVSRKRKIEKVIDEDPYYEQPFYSDELYTETGTKQEVDERIENENADVRKSGRPRKKSKKYLEAEAAVAKIKVEIDEDYETYEEDKENLYWEGGLQFSNSGNQIVRERWLDTKNRYYLKGNRQGKGRKGLLSRDLRTDLFDDATDELLSISVCTTCYKPFKSKEGLTQHREEEHKDAKKQREQGPCYISDTRYKCPTCQQEIEVAHLIWFVKHMRFCGKDDDKAKAILAPDQQDLPIQSIQQDKDPLDEDMIYVKKNTSGVKIRALAVFLLGVESDSIWGCRNCYEVFKSKEDLNNHIQKEHEGKFQHGSCYDELSSQYTCMYCNICDSYSNLVYFIRHIRQCLVDPSIGLAKDHEEEGVDDDTEDVVDPWGVVNKPLKVVNLRSHWIAESLFGKYVPIVYPCHVCYNAFVSGRELKNHFSTEHPDVENCLENGPYYNRDNDSYNCPVCKKEVCKNQKNSIYFTYHLKKCLGKTFTVIKSCQKCGKSFSHFQSYMAHQRNNCETNEFICHICSNSLKTQKDLTRHVQLVHSDVRPFMCLKCPKRFKRNADLRVHEQTHNPTCSYSCEHCGKAFNQKRALKRHMKTHLNDVDKPHQCQFCSLRFVRKQVLENHMATHGDAKRFGCEICNAQLKTKDALRAHRKKVHNLMGPLPVLPELINVEILPDVAANTVISDTDSIVVTDTSLKSPQLATLIQQGKIRGRGRKKKTTTGFLSEFFLKT